MTVPNYLIGIIVALVLTSTAQGQNKSGLDSTGLPGDNFSLQGALAMFQRANSLEDFEKMINSENNHVNNLDLNDDGEIDYIRVIDNSDKQAHALVLQDVVSEKESQDIAVIEMEKTGDSTVVIQIVGNEDIYGEQVIVEPGEGENEAYIDNSNNNILHGPNAEYFKREPGVIVNVWFWPSVRFVYAPAYVAWRSPWRWHYYPAWWRPWRPMAWHAWYPYRRPYYAHCAIVHTHRVGYAHRIYAPVRVTSVTVTSRNRVAVTNYRTQNYRVNENRTTVKGPRSGKMTTTRTTVRGPRGNIHTKTTVKGHR